MMAHTHGIAGVMAAQKCGWPIGAVPAVPKAGPSAIRSTQPPVNTGYTIMIESAPLQRAASEGICFRTSVSVSGASLES